VTSLYEFFADWGERIVFGTKRLGPDSAEEHQIIREVSVPITTTREFDSATDRFTLPGALTTEATSKACTFDRIVHVYDQPWGLQHEQRSGSKLEESITWP